MRTREAAVREAWNSEDDRGAVLFILVLFLVIFIAVATLAVDLASQGARGQDLQNTSDAAALAGVVEYQQQILADPLDLVGAEAAARAVVEEVMVQNGIDPSLDTIQLDINVSDDGSQLEVIITDLSPDKFLPNDLLGETIKLNDPSVERRATADFLACENLCSLQVQIEKSFGVVEARGDGDGYKPILVNQKLYALNHNDNNRQIVCISTITQENCWPDGAARTAYASGVSFFDQNPEMPLTAVVGSRIYWAATDSGSGHRLYCWETLTDVPCANAVTLDGSLQRYESGDVDNILSNNKDENRGGGTFTVLGQKVFSFTDNHRIHCWDPSINAICSGYGNGGNPTALGLDGFPASSPVQGNYGSSIDRIVDKTTGYVYATLHIPFAQNVDCSSSLADPAGQRVVVLNKGTGNYLASDVPDNVYAYLPDDAFNPADERMYWDVESFGSETLSFQSVAHGEYLDAIPFASTSSSRGEDDRWNIVLPNGVAGPNDSWFIDSDNLDFAAGGLLDDGGLIIEEEPPATLNAEWNFYPWQCGADPDRVDLAPDYFVDGTWLHCYNTGTVSGSPGPCPGFTVSGVSGATAGTPTPLHPDGTRFSGRLWFYYAGSAGPSEPTKLGVCSSGYSTWNDPADNNKDPDTIEINCVDINNGNFDSGLTSSMDPVRDDIRGSTGSWPGAWGDPHWNQTENRLFYPTEHDRSLIVCFDFDTTSSCGTHTGTVPPNPDGHTSTEDYGFVSDGNCVYGLGHTAYFWAFKASELGEPCDARIPPTKVERCACGDGSTFRWGELDFTEVDLSKFEVFGVRIITDDGGDGTFSLPIFPADGTFISIKPGGGDMRIPLDDLAIPAGAESILVEFDVQGLDEDAIEDAGSFEIRFAQRPKLVD